MNDLIAAAQKWGNMCRLAIAARMEGDDSLIKDRDSKSPALFPSQYEEAETDPQG